MGVAAVIGAVGAVSSVVQGRKAAKQQKRAAAESKKAQRVQTRMQDLQAMRERRQQAAQARVARSQQIAGGFASGVGFGSSAVQGAVGGISSQLASNSGFGSQMQGMANQASIFNQNAADFSTKANVAQGYSQMGASIFNMSTNFM